MWLAVAVTARLRSSSVAGFKSFPRVQRLQGFSSAAAALNEFCLRFCDLIFRQNDSVVHLRGADRH